MSKPKIDPASLTQEQKVDAIFVGMQHLIDFMEHAQKVASVMAKHPMFAAMIPPDIRKMADKG